MRLYRPLYSQNTSHQTTRITAIFELLRSLDINMIGSSSSCKLIDTVQSLSTEHEGWKITMFTQLPFSEHTSDVLWVKRCRRYFQKDRAKMGEAAIVTGMLHFHCLEGKLNHTHFIDCGRCMFVDFLETRSLHSLGQPGTDSVTQTGHKLIILLP